MKPLLAALFLVAGLLCPCARGQRVEEIKPKAEKGDADAQYLYGISFASKKGVWTVDSAKWFRKAAEQGHIKAQAMLGVLYEAGEGVAKDFVEAYAWWNLASPADKEAAEYRDELEKKMTTQQVADGQKRTKELRAMIEAKAKAAK
jgi:TPR repeat protein